MEILSSLSMISHPLFKEISCVFPDGTLNKDRVEYFVERAYRNGATGMRIFPGFLVDIKLFGNVPPEQWNYNYLPWEFDTDHMTIGNFQDQYLIHLHLIDPTDAVYQIRETNPAQ